MKNVKYGVLGLFICLLVAFYSQGFAFSSQKYVTIGTAGVSGVYYPVGGSICRFMNLKRDEHGLRCVVEATEGSRHNIDLLRKGDVDVAIVQSDVHANAYRGLNSFSSEQPFMKLRSLFSVHSEQLHLMVRKDSGIEKFEDVKGKKINISNPTSGTSVTMKLIFKELGWTDKDFAEIKTLWSAKQAKALCDYEVDALFFTAGSGNASMKEAAQNCDAKLIDLNGLWVDRFVKKYRQYSKTTIPADSYRGNGKDIETFGPRATVVSTSKIPEEAIYNLVSAVMSNEQDFINSHPAFIGLTRASMVKGAHTAPLHKGAERYFKELGLAGY
jgi:TRAP transporter TAXI family solute receptor